MGSIPFVVAGRAQVVARALHRCAPPRRQLQDTAEAWYGVGCYYYLCGKFEKARINFLKATSLNPYFAPAWLLLSLLSSHTRPTAICRASLSCQGLRRDCVSGWAREQVRLWAYLCGAG